MSLFSEPVSNPAIVTPDPEPTATKPATEHPGVKTAQSVNAYLEKVEQIEQDQEWSVASEWQKRL